MLEAMAQSDAPGGRISLRAISTALVVAVVATIAWKISYDPIWIAGGSDALTTVYRPPAWAAGTALLALVASVFLVVQKPAFLRGAVPRLAIVAITAMCMAFGLHAVVVDGREPSRAELRELWGPFVARTFRFNAGDGLAMIRRESRWNVCLRDSREREGCLFLGVSPFRIDPESLLAHPLLRAPDDEIRSRETR
jgi:hypothetical protein